MYRKQQTAAHTLTGIKCYLGESIERKVARVLSNKEAIKDNAPLIYTDRADGVLPDYDIRTDKYEHLVEGHDALAKSKRAKRDNIGKAQKDLDQQNKDLQTGPKSEGTSNNTSD